MNTSNTSNRISFFLNHYLYFILFVTSSYAQSNLPGIVDPLFLSPIADPHAIPKFVNPLTVVKSEGLRIDAISQNHFTLLMEPIQANVLGTGQITTMWGYGVVGKTPVTFPGPTFVTKKDVPITIEYINNLGFNHPMPLDPYVHYTFSMPPYNHSTISQVGVPAVVHLHGGHTDSQFDGGPESWFTPLYNSSNDPLSKGPGFVTNIYTYDNSQEASTLWYHDHALGITRLNLYMGLTGFYFVRDDNELNLISSKSIPSGDHEIEIAIQDRTFYPDGQLAFPNTPSLPGLAANQTIEPEFFGNAIMVNGKTWPYLNVEPRKYRFRILNGSDSRFYNLWLDAGNIHTNSLLVFKEIGTERGFLPSPVNRDTLFIAPAERYDVLIDFSDPSFLGKTITLKNNANTPYPNGNPVDTNTTGKIMQFRVGSTPVVDSVSVPSTLRPTIFTPAQTGPTRKVLLLETKDQFGRTKPMLGTADLGKLEWMDPVTENPKLNDVEVWEIYNTTMDAHPIHLHLVSFQIINRQKFHAHQDTTTFALSDIGFDGPPVVPKPEETGHKDSAVSYPGEVIRIIAKFDKPGDYVWHCHIISHEDHEMMRPFTVIKQTGIVQNLNALPFKFELIQNYPNPFNPYTNIRYQISDKSYVSLKVYDILGREVVILVNEQKPAGNYEVMFDGHNLTSGVYFYKLQSGSFIQTKKLMLIK